MRKNSRQCRFAKSSAGQAMLEYALLTSVVLVMGISVYMTGWFEGVQNYVYDILFAVSLPIP